MGDVFAGPMVGEEGMLIAKLDLGQLAGRVASLTERAVRTSRRLRVRGPRLGLGFGHLEVGDN